MNKLKLIIAREYKAIVMSKSFIFTTLLMPLIMVLCGAIPALIGYFNDKTSEAETIAVIDETGRFAQALHDTDLYHFVALRGDTATNAREFYDKSDGAISAVVIIPATIESKPQVTIYSEGTINMKLENEISNALSDTLSRAKLASYGIPNMQQMIDESSVDVNVKSVKWSDKGENESSTTMAMIVGCVLAFFTYMFVLMYGAMIMNGVVEEKTNRIVEVIVSSCKPFQLMMGKIIGIGLVGLTQLLIWVVLVGILTSVLGIISGVGMGFTGSMPVADASQMAQAGVDQDMLAEAMRSVFSINYAYILSCFVLYFIGGYLLFAAMFAAFGSAVDQASDAGQFTSPLIILLVIALYAGIACMENPNGPIAMWCSMIPFTSPIVMMVRLPYDVALWEIALSLLLLYGTGAGVVWVASRIYRTGILLYGKKHSLKDIFKWIK
ncbi:MAG: ABC transporter permease [Muribaculaceae bacterium]|nr:ABC transporter permease [Muribaculaceae bacterium]